MSGPAKLSKFALNARVVHKSGGMAGKVVDVWNGGRNARIALTGGKLFAASVPEQWTDVPPDEERQEALL